jgi:tetratricopeptide (TPR) repeat protein
MDAADSLLASSRVLVVATARPSLFERRPLWGEGLEYHVRLALQSLSRRSSRQLVGEILQKADQVPPSLTDLVVSTADGNPFYIEELVTWLLDAGVITRDGEHWHVAEERIDSTRVPPTLKGVLQARLDALSPAEHLTLQRAAVIGRVFWADAVDNLSHAPALTSHEPPATDEALDRLRSREVVFQREQSAFEETREFLFKHALLRDVTYDSVLKSHRQTYHGLAARWLEQRTERSRRADQYAGLIADHYDRAGDVTVAARWYLRAARQACSVHALPDADQLLDRALAILPEDDPGLRFDLLLARENVLERLGDREAQQATLALLDEAIAGSDDASRTVQVLLAGTRYAFNESDYSAQAVTARRAVELSKEAGLVETEVDARLWWGKGLAWEGQHDAARDVLEEALAGARATGQQVLVGETLRYLAIVANNCSEFPLAVELLEEARAVHHEDDDPENESVVLVQLASVLYNQGHYEEARRCLEEALPILTGSGYKYRQAVVTSNLGSIEMVQGELGAARRHLVEGLRLSQEVNDKESTAIGFGVLGELLVRVGELEEAETNLRRSLELAAEFDYGFVLSDSKLSLALALAQRGEYDIAIPLTADAVGDARRGGSRLAEARALCGQGSILLTAGRFDEATVPLHAGLALAEELALPSLARDATAALARCALDTECADEARALVERLIGHLGVADVEGCLQPGEVYRRCWRVLTGLGDPRAADVLEAAGTFLDAIASRIDEDDLREGFLHRVPAHAELLEARRAARR